MNISFGIDAIKSGTITVVNEDPMKKLDIELAERKGEGHPDSIADRLAWRLSRDYSRYCLENFGLVLHHQFDKIMIIGGKGDVTWGGGSLIEPMKIIVAGRVTKSYGGIIIPYKDIIYSNINEYFRKFPFFEPQKDLRIQIELSDAAGPGTIKESKGAISEMFSPSSPQNVKGYEKFVANDTSFCTGWYPYSLLERAIISLEQYLNSEQVKRRHPWLGTDIKIMGIKYPYDIYQFTICIPQISFYVHSLKDYQENLRIITDEIENFLRDAGIPESATVSLNTKDDYEKMNVYLTLHGFSSYGDIGVVGRGNRFNGIISARRSMSMEAFSGKNPRYYSGFIYSILAYKIARKIYEETHFPSEVLIVSQNGGHLTNPWGCIIYTGGNSDVVRNLVLEEYNNIPQITKDFVNGQIEMI